MTEAIKEVDIYFWTQIGVASFAFIIGFYVAFRKYVKKWGNSTKIDKEYWNIHSNIHELLTELRIRCDCARIQLVQFHNNDYFMDGVSMKKMSLTHESLNKGISSEGDKKQNVLLSRFVPLLNKILLDDPILYIVSEDNETYGKQFMESSSVVAYVVLPIVNKNSLIGYVTCQWCSWNKVDEIDVELSQHEALKTRNLIEVQLSHQKSEKR
jgi:hypothetical protein